MKFLKNTNCFWKCKTITSYRKLDEWFRNTSIFNKPIKRIITTDDVAYLNRGHFIDFYNNSTKNFITPIRYKDDFDISFINKDALISTYIPNKGAIIIVFEDNSTFEFLSSDYGVFHLSENKIKNIVDNPPKINMDIEKMFKNIIGKQITDVKIKKYKKTDYEYHYIKKWKAPKEQVFSIRLKLSDGKELLMKFQTFALLEDGNYPEPMRFEDYLDCIYDIEKCLRK